MSISSAVIWCVDCMNRDCEKCKKMNHEFYVVLEWKGKKESIETLEKLKCPCCGSDNWVFTDMYMH